MMISFLEQVDELRLTCDPEDKVALGNFLF